MYETWLYHYDRRQNNIQWSGGMQSLFDANIPSKRITWKISRIDFSDQDGILLNDYLPKGQINNA